MHRFDFPTEPFLCFFYIYLIYDVIMQSIFVFLWLVLWLRMAFSLHDTKTSPINHMNNIRIYYHICEYIIHRFMICGYFTTHLSQTLLFLMFITMFSSYLFSHSSVVYPKHFFPVITFYPSFILYCYCVLIFFYITVHS